MNERIKELAEQAKGFVDLNQHIGGTNGCMVYTYDGLEKFAELIVRECAELTLDYKSDAYYNGWLDYRNEIKRHFGVEE